MKKSFIQYAFILFLSGHLQAYYDVTVVGPVMFAESIARLPITFIDMLKDEVKINFTSRHRKNRINYTDIPSHIRPIFQSPNKIAGAVTVFFDLLWVTGGSLYPVLPQSTIKIAYSMLESTTIPSPWATILNNYFDAVVVPDDYLVPVYTNAGVKIPIFVLPCPLYLDDFLQKPIKEKAHAQFTFGMSAVFYPRKNFELLIDAFAQEFGNNPQVRLVLHARGGLPESEKNIRKRAQEAKVNNIYIIKQNFNQSQYINFLSLLDCYAFLSKGEGFSITPREALALGIPCILSNNTAHTTICNTDFVYGVPSHIKEPAYYQVFKSYCGSHFNCNIQDVRTALRNVYNNYATYLQKAHSAREWVQQYSYRNLKAKYLSLVKPKKVILGQYNKIENDYLMTNSTRLYQKYLAITH